MKKIAIVFLVIATVVFASVLLFDSGKGMSNNNEGVKAPIAIAVISC